ncbi:uncharacterized protein LOC113547632 [Pangasianodon hypophthalmus]|uniref:uncharacterized protein LOC113547632 n=1 Tax=Pangasianodon hypophthalmus TaxID=310915 RepID=UPI0023071DF8|nr:uncharacterized protein LOC113547632 [Pangasianodon hypophthalmus]
MMLGIGTHKEMSGGNVGRRNEQNTKLWSDRSSAYSASDVYSMSDCRLFRGFTGASSIDMKIIQLHFYLLVCCGAAESFTEKSVDLGQNVILKCEVSVKDVYWFLMKPPEPPLFILRSFSSRSLRTDYSNPAFSKTFSLQYNGSLFIHNISNNELGVYYCIQTGSPPSISSGIRLYTQNHSADNQMCEIEQQNQIADKDELWRRIMIVSGIMNCVVIVSVTVLIGGRCERSNSPKFRLQPPNHEEEQLSGSQNCFTRMQRDSTFTVVEFTQLPPEV